MYYYLILNSIDSINANEPNNSTFILSNFKKELVHSKVCLSQVILPALEYPVNARNNMLVFQEDGVATNLTATLEVGSYNATELATQIKTQLDTIGANTYTISYDEISYKYTITTDGTSVKFINDESTCFKLLGFPTTDTSFASSLTSSYPIRLDGTQFVDIVGSLPSNNLSSDNRPVLYRIPIDSSFGSIIYYKPPNEEWIDVKGDINTLDLRLIADDGRPYDLPANCEVQYTFQFAK